MSSSCAGNDFYGVVTFSNCGTTLAGYYTLTASNGTLTVTSNPFTVNPGPPTQLVFTTQPGNGTGGSAFSTQPVVAVEDAFGNQVTTDSSSVTLAIGTNPGPGHLTCTSNPLNATSGIATFTGCAIDKAAAGYTLTASDGTLTAATSSPLTVSVGPAAQLVFTTSPGNGIGGAALSTQPVVAVEDAGGNTVSSNTSAITLAIGTNPVSGHLTCTSNPLNATSGIATFSGCAIDKAGSGYTLTASDGTLTSASSSPFNIVAGSPTKFVITSAPLSGTAAWSDIIGPITVQEQDNSGNPTTAAEVVTLASSSSGTHIFSTTSGGSAISSISIPSGSSSATFYYGDTKAGTPTITASGSLTSGSQVETIVPGPAISLAITSTAFSAPASSSATHSITATLEDGLGNPTTSSSSTTVSVSSTSPGAKFAATSGGTSVTSVALPANTQSVSFFYGDALSGSPVITVSGPALSPDGTQTETITPAAATQLVITGQPPASTPAGTSFTTSVAIEDSHGNLVNSSAPVNLAIGTNPGSGALSCSTDPLNASGGVATFGCSINKVGTGYTLTASSSGLASTTTGAFTITQALPSKFVITSTPVSGVASSTATFGPITVQEQDIFGNPTTTAETVNLASGSSGSTEFAATSGGAAITSVSIPSGSSSATFYYGDTRAGTPTITASGSLTSATQVETVTAGSAIGAAVNPSPTSVTASSTTNVALSLQLQDQFGNSTTSSGTTSLVLSSPSGKDFFATSNGATGTLGSTITVTFASGVGTGKAYYGDEAAETSTITAKNGTNTWGTTTVTVNPGAASKVAITPAPTSVTASSTTNVTLSLQLQDQFGNSATSSGTTSLTLSSPSSKDFFNNTSGATGTLGGTISVTFANGVGTGTTYYGDETAETPTITAKNGSSSWGATTVTVTPGAGTKLVITSAAMTSAFGSSPNNPFTTTLEDTFGNATTSTVAITVNLSSTTPGNGTARFAATSGGSTVSSVSLPANSSSVTAYYSYSGLFASPVITVSATGLTSGSQTESSGF
ncbi:MAG TPA: hypothetical protein VGL48_01775 [Acidimicrobiales bacterium]